MIMSPFSKVEMSPLVGLIAEEVAHEGDIKLETFLCWCNDHTLLNRGGRRELADRREKISFDYQPAECGLTHFQDKIIFQPTFRTRIALDSNLAFFQLNLQIE